MNRTGRGVLGNKPASGTEIIQELGEEHQQTGKWIVYTSADSVFQIAAHEETIPLEELYDGCRVAREILTGKHAVGRVIARPFVGTPGRLRADAQPARLLARAAPAELPDRDPGRRPHGLRRRKDLATSSPAATSTSRSRRSRTSRASTGPIELLENIDDGLVFVNLVETDKLWGHRNDPVNFHRCLQDFDRRLPDILEALRDGDLLIITSDHGCDPTTPSTDHSREHALLLAYAAGRNAAGRIHEDGEFADVGATVSAWLGGKHPGKGAPGTPIISRERRQGRPMSFGRIRDRSGGRLAGVRVASGAGRRRDRIVDMEVGSCALQS